MKDVPIPFNLSKNDRDRRGFPIPFVVYRDVRGVPHFTVDDTVKLNQALTEKLCALCGKKLKLGQLWLISGPEAAFLDDGLYTTPPAHEECARYAIQVCPFLAVPTYSKLIEDKTLKPEAIHDTVAVHNDQIAPPRPPLLVLSRTSAITLINADDGSGKKYVAPRRPWKDVEFWRHARQISHAQARVIAAETGTPPEHLTWWPDQ